MARLLLCMLLCTLLQVISYRVDDKAAKSDEPTFVGCWLCQFDSNLLSCYSTDLTVADTSERHIQTLHVDRVGCGIRQSCLLRCSNSKQRC